MTKRTRNILLVVGSLLLLFMVWYFRTIVTFILVSSILGVIGRPMVRWLKKVKVWKFKLGSSVSALITLFVIGFFFFGLFRLFVPLLVSKFDELASVDVNEYLHQLEVPLNQVSKFFYGESVSLTDGSIVEVAKERLVSFFKISQVSDLFGTLAGLLGNLMLGIFSVAFMTFFFLRDEKMFHNGILMFVPDGFEERVVKSLGRISYLLRRYFLGIILEITMVMVLDTLGLSIVGLDFSDAVVIGMFCGLFNVIPYLGPWLGAAAGVLIGVAININADFMTETLPLIAWMVVVFGSVQVIDNILFQPLIYSSSVKAHPMEIFLVILAAGSVAGIIGMILAIPFYTILRVFGAEFLSEVKLIRKLTENMDQQINKSGS